MNKLRCEKCNKMLAKTEGDYLTIIPHKILGCITDTKSIDKDTCEIEIKCPRCGDLTTIIV